MAATITATTTASSSSSSTKRAMRSAASASTSTSAAGLEIRIAGTTTPPRSSKDAKGKARAIDPPLAGIDDDLLTNTSAAGRIYDWADQPRNAAKCFGSHILSMPTLPSPGFPQTVYLLQQRPVVFVDVVGMVVGVTEKEKRCVYLLDDGTAVLQVIELRPHSHASKLYEVGNIVRVVGRIRPAWEERALHAHSISQLHDRDEESIHIQAVAQALRSVYTQALDIDNLPAPPRSESTIFGARSSPPRKSTIPSEYLPPVFSNAAYYYSNAAREDPLGHRRAGGGLAGPTLPSPDATPVAYRPATPLKGPTLPSPSTSGRSSVPSSSGLDSWSSSSSQAQVRRLRAWDKLSGNELSASRFRPYVAQHIHRFCAGPSLSSETSWAGRRSHGSKGGGRKAEEVPPAFTVRYLRRQDDLRKHAECVVLRELQKRETQSQRKNTQAASSSSTTKLASARSRSTTTSSDARKEAANLSREALAAKVKRLFESMIRQLVDDGVIEVVPESVRVSWPFNGRRKSRFSSQFSARVFSTGAGQVASGGKRGWGVENAGAGVDFGRRLDDGDEGEVPFLGSSDSEAVDSDGNVVAVIGGSRARRAIRKGCGHVQVSTAGEGRRRRSGGDKMSSGTASTGRLAQTTVMTTPTSNRQYIVIPSSGASASLDADGRTRSRSGRPSRTRSSKTQVWSKSSKMGTNGQDDAISISSSSSTEEEESASSSVVTAQLSSTRRRGARPGLSQSFPSSDVEGGSHSSDGITSDTESEGDSLSGTAEEASDEDVLSHGAGGRHRRGEEAEGSPMPRANRRRTDGLLDGGTTATQRAAAVWRLGGGGGAGLGMSRTRARQEAYRLITSTS
ncbi:hypothetical protein V8E36_004399 [Tilletia maclaganii]